MKRSLDGLLLLVLTLLLATQAYPCTWEEGYFYQESALRGNVVGARIGPLQHIRWLRQSYARKNARLTLYEYLRPIKQRDEMPLVKTTKTDVNGRFDFGEVAPGHYTLIVDDDEWGTSEWFAVEVRKQAKMANAVTIDVSPPFPDCKGGHEFLSQDSHLRLLRRGYLVSSGVLLSLGIALLYLWNRRRRIRPMPPTTA